MVRELVPGLGREALQARSDAPLRFAAACAALVVPALAGG